jgi:hypothetical protein
LDPVKEPFDPVASAARVRAEEGWIVATAFGGDIGPRAFPDGEFSDQMDSCFWGKADIEWQAKPTDSVENDQKQIWGS